LKEGEYNGVPHAGEQTHMSKMSRGWTRRRLPPPPLIKCSPALYVHYTFVWGGDPYDHIKHTVVQGLKRGAPWYPLPLKIAKYYTNT
jgi:hypothetical protein